MSLTDFQKYVEEIVIQFDPNAEADAFENLRKAISTDIMTLCHGSDMFSLILDSGHDHDLRSLINEGTLIPDKKNLFNNMQILLDLYQRKFRIIGETLSLHKTAYRNIENRISKLTNINTNIRDELEILNNIAPFMLFKNKPVWKLPTFVLNDNNHNTVEFPDIYLELNFDQSSCSNGIRLVPGTNTPRIQNSQNPQNDFFHPHARSDGKICFGDAEIPIHKLWQQRKVVAITQILITTLNTYNPRSPYRPLENFRKIKQYNCDNCGYSVDENSVVFVDFDVNGKDMPGCQNCVVKVKKHWKWANDYIYSTYHKGYILKTNATKAISITGHWDYYENILSLPEFTSCPKCFAMAHESKIINTDTGRMCIKCNQRINSNEHESNSNMIAKIGSELNTHLSSIANNTR